LRLALLVVALAPLFGSGCASMPAPSPAPPQRPLNIVLLYADDWRHDTLGCAGNPVVRTPAPGSRLRSRTATFRPRAAAVWRPAG
jgi:hypothetical protein